MSHDIEQARRFLTLLDETAENFTFQTFDDKPTKNPALARWMHGDIDTLFNELINYNKLGAGVFVMVQGGDGSGRNIKSVNKIRCIFNENDHGVPKKQPLEPQIVVETSPGKSHYYFLVDGLELDDFKPIQNRLIAEYGSDKNAHDLPRVMRLPGFYHNKMDPHLVTVVHESGGQRYSREQIIAAFPPYVKETVPTTTKPSPKLTDKLSLELRSALGVLRSAEYSQWVKIGMALSSLGDSGRGLWLEWSQQDEGFDFAAACKKWETFKPDSIGYKSVFSEAQAAGWANIAKRAATGPGECVDEAQEWKVDLSGEIDYLIPFPCLARDIQEWIIATSVKVQPALAFAATMSVLAVVSGRDAQVGGTKGGFIGLCLAESGEGKDWPLKSCHRLLDSVGLSHHVYGEMASGAALVESIAATPSALLQIDEAGHYFATINSKGSSQFSREIMPIITKCYTSSADYYQDKARKGQDGIKIIEPNLNVLGMSTERQIMDTLKTSEVADGSLARFMVIFGLNNVSINQNRQCEATVPETIKSRLELLKGSQFLLKSKRIVLSDDYLARKIELEHYFNELAIKIGSSGGDKAMFKPFYYRLAVRSIALSLLIDQCYSIDVLNWCADIVKQSCDVFVKKFCHLAADNDNEKYVKIIERAIKESGVTGITASQLYNKTRSVESGTKRRILNDLIEADMIFSDQDKGIKKPITRYFWKK